jgi:ubiquinone/menaquinone biosynthesis C-methylase UbiE
MIDYDQFAADYVRHRRAHPEVLRHLSGAVGASSRILEVGCGSGNYLGALAASAGCSCLGIDPSEEMLARARERFPGMRFQGGRAEGLEFPPERFDLVFSVDAIHHVTDCPRYFGEAWRVLAPGGKVCTVTDSEWIIRHRQPLAHYFPDTVAVDLGRYPAVADLEEAMHQAGFVAVNRNMVEFRYELTDVRPYKARAYSCLRLLSDDAFQAGVEWMERDLAHGSIPCISRYELVWGTKGDGPPGGGTP